MGEDTTTSAAATFHQLQTKNSLTAHSYPGPLAKTFGVLSREQRLKMCSNSHFGPMVGGRGSYSLVQCLVSNVNHVI